MVARQPLALIYNPLAGSSFRLRHRTSVDEAVAVLRQYGGDPHLLPTREPHDGFARGEEAGRQFPLVAVLGGDGTINEVVNGLVAAGSAAPLLVLPGGSVNVLARDLRIPLDARAAAALLREGMERRVFLGRAGPRYFVLMAGAGLDASIVRRLSHRALKRRLGAFAFILEGLRHSILYRFPRLAVCSEAGDVSGYFAVVGNSPGYGGWFSITPGADPGQPGFQVAVCRSRFALKYFYFTARALTGTLQRSRDFIYFEVPRLRIVSEAPVPVHVQVDGEPAGVLPMDFVSDGTHVQFIVPPPPRR